jgi:phage terminase Nu1 subunit (DNA packaging protein)
VRLDRGELADKQRCCATLGMTRQGFDQCVARGMPVVERPDGQKRGYKVHLGEVVTWLVEQARDGAKVLDLDAERARLAKEQADAQELRNAVARGELIPADQVIEGWRNAIGRARSLLLALPPAAAEELALVADGGPAALRERLADMVHAALAELADTSPDDDDGEAAAA